MLKNDLNGLSCWERDGLLRFFVHWSISLNEVEEDQIWENRSSWWKLTTAPRDEDEDIRFMKMCRLLLHAKPTLSSSSSIV